MLQVAPRSGRWRMLFAAFAVSALGTQFTAIALYPRLQSLGGNPNWYTLLALAQAVPALVVGPLAGGLADRGWRVRLLIASDLLNAVLLLLIANTVSLAFAVVLAGFSAAASGAFYPAEAVLETTILDERDLAKSSAVRAWTLQLFATVGPAVAGSLLAITSASNALVCDSLSYVASAALIAVSQAKDHAPGTLGRRSTSSLMRSVFEAVPVIVQDLELRVLFAVSALVYLLLGMQGPVIYSVVTSTLHGTGATFGLLMASLGAGMVLASALLTSLRIKSNRVVFAILVALAFDSVALFVFSVSRVVALSAAAMFCMGVISACFLVFVRLFLQTRPRLEIRGRVYGWYWGAMNPLSAIALLAILPLVGRVAPTAILSVASVLEFVTAAVVLAVMAVRPR